MRRLHIKGEILYFELALFNIIFYIKYESLLLNPTMDTFILIYYLCYKICQ